MLARMAESVATEPTPGQLRGSLPTGEQRFVVQGVSFKDYVVLREALDVPGLRMTYCEGMLELMSPSTEHENKKKTAARLVEIYALERGVRLYGYGSATFRREAKARGAEPDECWTFGAKIVHVPDVALEIVVSSGGIDKLDVYQGLGVREVWFYEDGAFDLYALGDDGYRRIERSAFVPELDFGVLARFVALDDQHEAAVTYCDWVRGNHRSE